MSGFKAAPAFQFYPGDWLGSTSIALMSPAEEGGYIRLLCHAWNDEKCSLPDDDDALAQLSRLGEGWFNGGSTKIRAMFKKKGKRLYNPRLLNVWKKQREWREKSRAGGINSAKARKTKAINVKGGSTTPSSNSHTKGGPKGNSSSSSLSSREDNTEKKENTELDFTKVKSSRLPECALTAHLVEKILVNDSKAKIPANLRPWVNECRLLMEKDERSADEVRAVIDFSQGDNFWRSNILSMTKLRKQFPALYLQLNPGSNNGKRGKVNDKKFSEDVW